MSDLTRKLDLLMPNGEWYRTVEAYQDDEHFLEPLFGGSGTFIASTLLLNGAVVPGDHETFIRCSSVQALRWVTPD